MLIKIRNSIMNRTWKEVSMKAEKYLLEYMMKSNIPAERVKKDMGIDSYLTGLSGGVRYTPVVRYNKVHVYIAPEDIQEAIIYLEIKEVDSGSNVIIFPLENDSYIKDYRVIDDSVVVSPLQIYLDSMQIKGRGEEMAEAVLKKEIIK